MAETQRLANATAPAERLKILEDIVKQLSHAEGTAVIQMISEQGDRLPTLPVELLGEILSYLPLFYPWTTLSKVSKKWHTTFLSNDLLRRSLTGHWNIHDTADSAAPNRDGETVQDKRRHIQAMRTALPFSAAEFSDLTNITPGPLLQQRDRAIALKGSRIAYIKAEREVVLRDLVSGATQYFRGAARGTIQCIALSSKTLAFVSLSGQLYVCDLSEQDLSPKEIRLPSAMITAVTADEYTVAMVATTQSADVVPCSVLLYDHETGHLRSFDFPDARRSGPCVLLVDSHKQHVDVFSPDAAIGQKEMQSLSVEHKRYNFDGKEISSSSWHRPPKPRESKKPFLLGDLHPMGRKGHFVFRTQLIPLEGGTEHRRGRPAPQAYILLCFDSHRAQLYEHHFGFEYNRSEDVDLLDYTSLALWKDVEFRGASRGLWISTEQPLTEDDSSRYRSRDIVRFDGGRDWDARRAMVDLAVLVNDSFLVAFGTNGSIGMFCFEEGLECAAAERYVSEEERRRNRVYGEQRGSASVRGRRGGY